MSRTIILLLSSLLWFSATAQQQGENIVLNSPIIGGQHSYMATQSIRMLPGFSYKPVASGDFFKGGIEDYIPQEVTPPTAGTIGGPGGEVGDDGVVGGAKGNFGVNEYGQAAYNFPLEFPGGRGGMTPELNLIYNSSGGDGILGPGWSLGGLSVINAVPATRHHNGVEQTAYGLDYNVDTYTLDGKRLVLIERDVNAAISEYRTEQDDFSRIYKKNRPSKGKDENLESKEYGKYFIVQTKGGLTYYYGEIDTKSRLEVANVSGNDEATISYYVSRVSDHFGNEIRFHYDNIVGDATTGSASEIYLKEITYSHYSETYGADYSISFVYENRIEPKFTRYIFQGENSGAISLNFKSSRLIDQIVCKYLPDDKVVKTYDLSYVRRGPGYGTKKYLNAIQEFGLEDQENNQYNKTVFEWEEEMNYGQFETVQHNLPERIYHDYNLGNEIQVTRLYNNSLVDLDGDFDLDIMRTYERIFKTVSDNGYIYHVKHDLIIELLEKKNDGEYLLNKHFVLPYYDLYDAKPYETRQSVYSINAVDVNGNGLKDIIVNSHKVSSGNAGQIEGLEVLLFKNEENFQFDINNSLLIDYNDGFYVTSFGDFNGDGIGDLLVYENSGKLIWKLGDKTQPLQSNTDGPLQYQDLTGFNQGISSLSTLDLNGDGRSEIQIIHQDITRIYRIFPKTDNTNNIQLSSQILTNDPKPKLCYLNSDRKLDEIKISADVDYNKDSQVLKEEYNKNKRIYPKDKIARVLLNAKGYFGSGLSFSAQPDIDKGYNFFIRFETLDELDFAEVNDLEYIAADTDGDGISEIFLDMTVVGYHYNNQGTIDSEVLEFKKILYVGESLGNITVLDFDANMPYMVTTIDINNDLQQDLISSLQFGFDLNTLTYLLASRVAHRITTITNSMGASTGIEYDFTSNPYRYTPGFEANYPVVPYNSSMPVVKSVSRQNGVGGWHTEYYKYEKAIAHAEGLGFMGFLKTVRTDYTLNRKYITEYEYDDTFYYTYPALQKTNYIHGNNLMAKTQSVYHRSFDGLNGKKYYYIAPDESITEYYHPMTSVVYKVEKQKFEDYDDYGNPRVITTSNGPSLNNMHFETVLEQSFQNFTNSKKWMLSRLRTATTTKKTLNQQPEPAIVISSAFQYYGGGDNSPREGMLYKEILHDYDQNNPNHIYKTTKTYTYDDFGNITTTLLTADNDQRVTANNRLSTTTYTKDGRFVETLVNSMLHTTSRSYDEVLGTLQSETDVDNDDLTASFEYDAFGRLQKTIAPDQTQQAGVLRWVENGDPDAPDNDYAVYYSWQRSSGQTPVKVYYSSTGLELRTVTINFDGETVYVDQLYDSQGRLSKKSEPYIKGSTAFYTTLQYDKFNRIYKQFAPNGGITTITYDGLTTITERKVSSINEKIQKSVKVLNTAGWVRSTEDHYGTKVSNTYTSNGRVHTKKIAGNNATARYFEYDINGNLISYIDSNQDIPITYSYNAFNELISETNAKNQTTTYDSYDALSRLLQKTDPNGQLTTYSYDDKKTGLPDWIDGPGHKVEYAYDDLLRVKDLTETIDNEDYVTSHTYDQLGRLSNLVYPGGYTITHHYNSSGYQNKITEAATGILLWEGTTANARNQFTLQHIGEVHEQHIDYYAETGLVENIISGGLQDNHYNWDLLGNLTFRNTLHGKAESFGYDYLNRLVSVYHNGSPALNMEYDELGNITNKSDVGTYEYLTDKPYQLDNINNKPPQIGYETQEVTYNYFNKVILINETYNKSQLVRQMSLQYGVNHQRIRQNIWTQDGFESEKIYVGGIYELETINRETTALHYIYGPSGLVAIKKQEMEGNTTSLQFVLNDHLGSIQLLTDEQGNLIEEYSYDAWGMRRDPYTFELSLTGSSEIAYGFTGHEQLDLFKLVNMNGRMYDPVVGRFLSPDPVLQFPNFTQGLNPYSYALNNPLRFTDPSGYSLIGQMAALTASILFSGGNPIVAAGIYAAFMTMDHIIESGRSLSAGQFLGYFTQTFTLSVVSAGGSQAIGNMLEGVGKLGRELLRASAHGVFNGTMRLAQGGKFEHGFLSGFVSSLGGSFIVSYGGNMTFAEKTVISATIGGTAEALGGGKFANGAVTGAYVMMLNHLMHDGEGKNVPSKEWIQEKVNAAIEAERDKIQNWIDGNSGALNIDFNFDNFNNSDAAFGLYNNQVMYKIDLMISGETYIVDVVYMPSGNPNANIVTDIIPAGVAAYYGVPRGQQGKFQLHFSSHVFGGKKYLPIIIYLGKPAYLNYINYTRDEE